MVLGLIINTKMILDLNDLKKENKREESISTPQSTTDSSGFPLLTDSHPAENNHRGQIIKRVLHTRTEIMIYPSGQTFQTSRSWFEGETYIVKKKEKPKAEIKETKSNSLEQY